MSEKVERVSVAIEDSQPISLKIARTSRGQYRWEIAVKGLTLEEVVEKIQKIDEECKSRFTASSTDTMASAPKQSIESENLLPAPAFSIKYRGHVLGKIILERDKTFIRIDESVKVRLDDPAIKNFLIPKIINPILEKYRTTFNPLVKDGSLSELVINTGLIGEDADSFVKAVRWAIAKAYARPLQSSRRDRGHDQKV